MARARTMSRSLQNERAADGEQDRRHLVLDQGAETQSEEAQQDGGRQEPGHTAPSWSVTWSVTPPSAAFQGRPTAATATKVSSAMRMAHAAVTMTLAAEHPGPHGGQHERRRDGLVPVLAGDAEHAQDRGEEWMPK